MHFPKTRGRRIALAGALVCIILSLIGGPTGLLRPDSLRVDAPGRLLYEVDDYGYYAMSAAEDYATGVWQGHGEYVGSVAFRLKFDSRAVAAIDKDAELHAYLMKSDGEIVADEYIPLLPKTRDAIYRFHVDQILEDGFSYQFVLAQEKAFPIGVICEPHSSAPYVVADRSQNFPSAGEALLFQRLLMIFLSLILLGMGLALLSHSLYGPATAPGSDPHTVLLPVLGLSALALLMMMLYGQYVLDHVSEYAAALSQSSYFLILQFIFWLLGSVLILARPTGDKNLLPTPLRRLAGWLGREGFWSLALLLLAIPYVLRMPEGLAPDEANHFYRAFQLSCGGLFARVIDADSAFVGQVMPRALSSFADPNAVLDWSDMAELNFNNTALYAPICYLPQLIALRIARLFTGKVHVLFMTARWAGFAGSYALSVLALRKLPYAKDLLGIVLLLPMTLQEMCSVSSDALTNALAFFFVALVLSLIERCASGDRQLTRGELILLGLTGTALSLCKIVYVVLLFLILLIPVRRFAARWQRPVVLAVPLAAALLVNRLYGSYLVSYGEGIDAGGQVRYVLTHPGETFWMLMRSFTLRGSVWLSEMTGDYLGSLNIRTATLIVPVLLMVLVMAVTGLRSPRPRRSHAFTYLGLATLGALLVLGSIYVTWTEVGAGFMPGIQGRYFLPFLPLFGLGIIELRSLPGQGSRTAERDLSVGYLLVMGVVNALAVTDIYRMLINTEAWIR